MPTGCVDGNKAMSLFLGETLVTFVPLFSWCGSKTLGGCLETKAKVVAFKMFALMLVVKELARISPRGNLFSNVTNKQLYENVMNHVLETAIMSSTIDC